MGIRSWGARALAAIAGAVLLVAGVGVSSASAEDGWVHGPVDVFVPIDTTAATAGLDEVTAISAAPGTCSGLGSSAATWVGGGVVTTVVRADADSMSCTVTLRIDYCYWNVFFHYCDGVRYATVGGSVGPVRVDPDPPQALGATPVGSIPTAGWFRTPGTIQWFGVDTLSGISSCSTAPLTGPDTTGRTVQGYCIDKAGNPSAPVPFTYKYDATPPTLSPTAPSPVAVGATAHADAGASDATSGLATSSCNGGSALDTTTPGTHTVTCVATDNAGNTASATVDYLVDAPPDTVRPLVSLVSPTTAGPFAQLTVKVEASDGVGLKRIVANIYQGSTLVKSTQSAMSGAGSGIHQATVALADGSYTVKYNAQDLAGNTSTTGTFAFVIDATAPTATIKDGTSYTLATGASYDLISFKLFDSGKIDKVVINGTVKDLSDNAWSDVNYVKPGVFGAVSGVNTLVVYDVAGNAQTYTFTLN